MTRLEQSSTARRNMGEDFFGGWEEADVELFREFAMSADAVPGKIVDFMGVKTSTEFHPWATHHHNSVIAELPVPDDSLRAEAIEYFAFFDALKKAPTERFSMAEIGSSYGPWTCAAAVCAARMGKTNIRLSAVEASSYLFGLIKTHLSENDVSTPEVRLINGAAASQRTQLYFPIVTSPGDNGGQACTEHADKDYLNRSVEYEEVEAYPLDQLLPTGEVDLIHMDVQGSEFEIIHAGIDVLNSRVRNIFIGTHARIIEGQLLELFHAHGWKLMRERPTRFSYHGDRRDIVAWTTRDGGQYWNNPLL